MKRKLTTLTDATLITAVVQTGYGEIITDALLEVGIQGASVHSAMGTGIRERLDAERDIVTVIVSSDEVDRLFERVYLAARLDTPGMGFMYATPLVQAATYVPPTILKRFES